jgi:hypothetical protein
MEPKHSGIGIASFVISIMAGGISFLLVLAAGAMEASTPGGIDEESAAAIVLGLMIIGMVILNLVALGLGIGGLLQKERKKIFAILGTIFSGLTVAGIMFLMILGSMVG